MEGMRDGHRLHHWLTLLRQLKPLNMLPSKYDVYFRYDPAVLIVSLTWHETKEPYGWHLRDYLRMLYADHEDLVGGSSNMPDVIAYHPEDYACGCLP